MTQSDITPTVLLTGPTSGIGAAILRHLSVHPSRPRLLLAGRDPDRLARAVDASRAAGLHVHPIRLDLADLDSVADASSEISRLVEDGDVPAIDVAILNAGAQFTDRRHRGVQGWELTFTVNVVAQHSLLRGIRPLLAPGAHVVMMGSSTHRGKRASFHLIPDPVWQAPELLATAQPLPVGNEPPSAEREAGGIAYASSKLALVTLAHRWAKELAKDGVRLNTYDPGLVAGTGLGRDMPGYRYWVWRRLMPAMSVLPGATTAGVTARHAVELALGDTHADLRDGYVEIGRVTRAEAITFDEARQADLWDWLERAADARSVEPIRRRTP